MSIKYLTAVLGLTSAIALNTVLPVHAEPQVYLEVGGRESLELNPDTLDILKDIGLTFLSSENTALPAPGFSIGSALLPPSSVPGVRGTTFTFLYEDDSLLYVPLGGTEEFSGSFAFSVDTSKLTGLGSELRIGNFSNAFDETFNFFITDTLTTNLRILDVTSSGVPKVDLNSRTWELEGLELFFSQEFSTFLERAGATRSVVGLKFADAKGDRSFVPVSVPESSTVIPLFISISVLGAINFKNRFQKLN
ncbi:PEP-CTERM sorting domain-containing protein [Anabaena sp. CCY 9910]|uniref:PEP-CTERM sorting domain-containing protein n=1 Tax=Anabaena sp. CCY 9910 TaxID=3103870 RepID=UPI0039E0D77E